MRQINFIARRGRTQRGSALLIVLVFSAIIAIMLYREMPIAAFEAQRQKEALAVARGNQYKRGVKLFVRKVGRFPASIEELESTNRMRFLRRRYVDPLSGKDDWRLIHAGPGGVIIDSKVVNKNAPANGLGQGATFAGFNNSFAPDPNANGDGEVAGAGLRQRPSATQNAAAANGDPLALPQGSALTAAPQDPNGAGPSPIQMAQLQQAQSQQQAPGQSGSGGLPDPNQPAGQTNNTSNASAAQVFSRQLPFDPATGQALANGQSPAGGPPGADAGTGLPPQPGNSLTGLTQQLNNVNPASQEQSPAQKRAAANGAALGGPANVVQGGLGASTGNGQIMAAGGIAGVASKAQGKSIKTVNDQTKYSLWEFYYDMRKEQQGGANGMPGGQQGSPLQQGQQQTLGAPASPGFGQPTGATSGGFGQSSTPSPSGFGATQSAPPTQVQPQSVQ